MKKRRAPALDSVLRSGPGLGPGGEVRGGRSPASPAQPLPTKRSGDFPRPRAQIKLHITVLYVHILTVAIISDMDHIELLAAHHPELVFDVG